ncbi:MAG TPA: FAD-dependent oxidoreductase, partial [Streptosporangiaceae bacterium]
SVPLGVLHGQAAGALLTRLGAQVRLSAKAAAIEVLPGGPGPGFRVRLAGRRGGDGPPPHGAALDGAGLDGAALDGAGEVIEADGVVLAVPPAVAARLAPAGTAGGPAATGNGHGPPGQPGPEQWQELATSPIVNVHVIYDRRVTRLPFAAAVDSPVQWVFDRTGPSGLRSGQYLAVSLSAADGYVNVPASALRERFLPAMADLFPAARDARVTDFFVTRERRATLRQVPGCERLRPGAATALPGLVLAGAWTDTGWPDTMEGAVRSGLYAARALRRGLAVPAGTFRQRDPGRVNGSDPVTPGRTSGPAGAGATA